MHTNTLQNWLARLYDVEGDEVMAQPNDAEDLARKITLALIQAGLLNDRAYTAASRTVRSVLEADAAATKRNEGRRAK